MGRHINLFSICIFFNYLSSLIFFSCLFFHIFLAVCICEKKVVKRNLCPTPRTSRLGRYKNLTFFPSIPSSHLYLLPLYTFSLVGFFMTSFLIFLYLPLSSPYLSISSPYLSLSFLIFLYLSLSFLIFPLSFHYFSLIFSFIFW